MEAPTLAFLHWHLLWNNLRTQRNCLSLKGQPCNLSEHAMLKSKLRPRALAAVTLLQGQEEAGDTCPGEQSSVRVGDVMLRADPCSVC